MNDFDVIHGCRPFLSRPCDSAYELVRREPWSLNEFAPRPLSPSVALDLPRSAVRFPIIDVRLYKRNRSQCIGSRWACPCFRMLGRGGVIGEDRSRVHQDGRIHHVDRQALDEIYEDHVEDRYGQGGI